MKANSWLCRWLPGWFRPSWDECTLASCWDGQAIMRDSHQRAMEKAHVAYLKSRQEGDD